MIDQCHLISVVDLRALLNQVSNPLRGIEYALMKPSEDRVLIRFNDDPTDIVNLNALCYAFPIVTTIPGLAVLHKDEEAGLMVLLSVYVADALQRGYYPDDRGDLKQDPGGDWNRFWPALAALLAREYESL
jgi:hypothetical protein